MQQRQLRLGDILDDYCPRERRLTNHAVVAMVGDEVKQTRCTTCEAEHEYKHAKVPRQRRKDSVAALQAQVIAAAPKRIVPDLTRAESVSAAGPDEEAVPVVAAPTAPGARPEAAAAPGDGAEPAIDGEEREETAEIEGPAHRRLIRATLPRPEGQPPATRPAPDFTIRHPGGGRPNRFRPRHQRTGNTPFQGNRPGGQHSSGPGRGGMQRNSNPRAPMASRPSRRHDGGRKRSK
jgi:hypothetical protein